MGAAGLQAEEEAGYPCSPYLRISKARALAEVVVKRRILDEMGRWRHHAVDDGWYSCSQATDANDTDGDGNCGRPLCPWCISPKAERRPR
jgi:hypothetical protein